VHLSLFTTFYRTSILVCPPNIFDKSTPVLTYNMWYYIKLFNRMSQT